MVTSLIINKMIVTERSLRQILRERNEWRRRGNGDSLKSFKKRRRLHRDGEGSSLALSAMTPLAALRALATLATLAALTTRPFAAGLVGAFTSRVLVPLISLVGIAVKRSLILAGVVVFPAIGVAVRVIAATAAVRRVVVTVSVGAGVTIRHLVGVRCFGVKERAPETLLKERGMRVQQKMI